MRNSRPSRFHNRRSGSRLRGLHKWVNSLLTLTLLAPFLVGVSIGVLSAAPAASAQGSGALTPPSKSAYIFNTFSGFTPSLNLDTNISNFLGSNGEHYHVTLYQNTATGFGDATVSRLLGLIHAGVLVINAHSGPAGLDIQTYGQCEFLAPGAPFPTCNPTQNGVFDRQYLLANRESNKLNAIYGAATAVSYDSYPLTDGTIVWRWDIVVLAAALSAHFGSTVQGIVDVNGCDSLALANDFHPYSFFGNSSACSGVAGAVSAEGLWEDLAGQHGASLRVTTSAKDFSTPFGPAPYNQPVTLSPAVSSVLPSAGSIISSGDQSGSVAFDTTMNITKSAKPAISISGCGVKLQSASWATNGNSLDFNYTMPVTATGTVTFTVNAAKVKAQSVSEGPNNELDGNQSPPNTSGEAPNQDNYVWTANCNSRQISATVSYSVTTTTTVRNAECVGACPTLDWNEDANLTVSFSATETCNVDGGDQVLGCSPVATENSASGSQTITYFQHPELDCMATYSGAPLQYAIGSGAPSGVGPALSPSTGLYTGAWTVDWGNGADSDVYLTGNCGPLIDPAVSAYGRGGYMWNALWAPGTATFTGSFSQSIGGSACEPGLVDYYGNPTTYCQSGSGNVSVTVTSS